MIYLATPFSSDGPAAAITERLRFDQASAMTHWFLCKREPVFSPIVYCYPVHRTYGLPGTYHFWKALNEQWITACETVRFAVIPGFVESIGMSGEWSIACSLQKLIEFWKPTFASERATYRVRTMERIACLDSAKIGCTPYLSMLKTLNLLDTFGPGPEYIP